VNLHRREAAMTKSSPLPVAEAAGAAGDASRLLQMIWGTHISRAVYVAAELGIADLLADGPVDCADLAAATGCREPALYRVLRLLAALDVFAETGPRVFGLRPLGDRLRTGVPGSMRSWATFLEALGGVRPFGHLLETVRTGEPGFDLEHGMPLFQFLAREPESAAVFDAAMSERTSAFAASVAVAHAFSDVRTVVDVGGGDGTLLVAILRRHAHLSGVLVETPSVAARASAVLDAADIANRCEVLAGDFFACLPGGADCYLLANVLHDWDDARSIRILRSCRDAMARGGRVLIAERLIPDEPAAVLPALLSDINMLVITGGQERTNDEYARLLAAAGLTVAAVRPATFPYGVIEAVLAG
jgi:SAM-dependent methyltransferase